ncbi:hypothetical protein QFC21_004393 [Naganishia friedmannii]|uniref:Uncharacterized protein n=1 Tax=Naganishia friedmannii TaxID=89922 RepID=A0ACC2VIM2_9TREE|nr:hypothetical protein QFC21_004393 [Naganishia friedmannii]
MTRALALLSALLLYSSILVSSVHAYAYPSNTTLVSRGWFGGSDGGTQQSPASQNGAAASSSSSSSSSASGGSKTANVGEEIIDFLQVMFEGGINWITLVNATQSSLGSCLGLSTFSSLIVQGTNGSFATGVDTYLTGMCGGTKCTTETLKYWKYKIQGDCKDDMEQPMLKTLNVVMNNYETSLYDLACKVHLWVLALVYGSKRTELIDGFLFLATEPLGIVCQRS